MRPAQLVVLGLCIVAIALVTPQLAAKDPLVSNPFGAEPAPSEFGPVEGSYFRVMSYDRYTGTGWERTATPEPIDTLEPPDADGEGLRIRYEATSTVRTAPAPWRPTAYDGPPARAVDGAIEPVEQYQPGDRFTVTSQRPDVSPTTLQQAGTAYPDGIDRYRDLPDGTPHALERAAGDITAGAGTPYETAVAVNRWLRTQKDYTLTVDRPADDVATTFVTEMDAGFCEYFATAMVALLRAEDVPARYVTGYTPYEQADNGEHVIRGKYAHTWVEVYFPEVGWVAFDPTPPDPRRAERGLATVDGAAGGDSALRAAPRVTTQEDDESGGWRQLDADIDLEGRVAAGRTVTVRVRDPDDGSPIQGAQVRFNGRPVGETDGNGELRAVVPYNKTLTVAAYVYDGEGDPPPVTGTDELSTSIRDLRYAAPETEVSASLEGFSDEVLFRATVVEGTLDRPAATTSGGQALRWQPNRLSVTATQGTERTFGVNTTIDVTVTPASGGDGTEQPGEPLTVRATIEDQPVPEATVTAGDRTATTDANGTATIPAPYERPAVVTVERGEASGEARITVRGELNATAGSPGVAGELLEVTATLADGTPVPNATVTNGVETATTNAKGVATIPAPYEPPWTIAVRRGDFKDSVERPVATGAGNLTVDPRAPGPNRTLRAAFREVPIRTAVVTVDGEQVGRTDRSGSAAVTLPYAETAAVTVERGGVTAERTVQLRTDAAVTTDGLPYPGNTVGLRATLAGEPLPGATVRVNGREVGKTDADGAATVRVPPTAPTVDVRVTRGAVSASTGLTVVTVVWAAAVLGIGGAVVLAGRRRLERGSRDLPGPTGAVLDIVRSLLGSIRAYVAATLTGGDRSAHLDAIRSDLAGLRAALVDSVSALVAAVRSRLGALLARLAGRDADAVGRDDRTETASSTGTVPSDEPRPPPGAPADENEVYRAWASFQAGVGGDGEAPDAVAARAVAAGLPESAVTDLTRTFQAVRYGGAEVTPERERRAREALERIREAAT